MIWWEIYRQFYVYESKSTSIFELPTMLKLLTDKQHSSAHGIGLGNDACGKTISSLYEMEGL